MRRRRDLAIAWAIFIPLAYLPNLAPKRSVNLASLTLFWSFFCLTLIILCDQITIALEYQSLLHRTTHSGRAWLSLLFTGALSGVFLDGFAQWLGKLWIYPYWSLPVYATTFVIGFSAYWLATAETYLAAKAVLCRRQSLPLRAMKIRRYEPLFLRVLGIAGAALSLTGTVLLWNGYSQTGYIFEIQKTFPIKTSFGYFVVAFIGIWFTLEWIQFARGRLSLLQAIVRGHRRPAYALLISSGLSGLFWETVNAGHHFWIYTNWPFPQWRVAGIPVVVLLSWPLQYIVFLSLGFLVGYEMWE